jgi:hypothetical protein
MVGVPYLTLGMLCFMIYRGCKKNEQFKTLMQAGEKRVESDERGGRG